MADREKVIRIIDELIFEAQKEPTWKAENALRCLKKELLKEQGCAIIKEPDCRICAQNTCRYYHDLRKPSECRSYIRKEGW